MVGVNQTGSSSQGQCPPPGWMTSVACGNNPANFATTLGRRCHVELPAK